MKKNPNNNVSPLTKRGDTAYIKGFYLDSNYNGLELKIDWFQASFDFINVSYDETSNRFYLDVNNPLFVELIKILNPMSDLIKGDYDAYIDNLIETMQARETGLNRFKNGYYIGEHIQISFGGNQTKAETYPLFLMMSGEGCREFELAGGDWDQLFDFILTQGSLGHLKIGRLDVALDDFDGNIISIYDLYPYLKAHDYISPLRKIRYDIEETHALNPTTVRYNIYLGTKGNLELNLYDKLLERKARDMPDKNVTYWARYEMRLYDQKALQVLSAYLSAKISENHMDFMKFYKGLLLKHLDLKVRNPKQLTQKEKWVTVPNWLLFLDQVEKVDLGRRTTTKPTIETKASWYKSDLKTTLLEFRLAFGEQAYNEFLNDCLIEARLDEKQLKRVNNYKQSKNEMMINRDDIEDVKNSLMGGSLTPLEQLNKTLLYVHRALDYFDYQGLFVDEELNFSIDDHIYTFEIYDGDQTIFNINKDKLYVSYLDVANEIKIKKIIQKFRSNR